MTFVIGQLHVRPNTVRLRLEALTSSGPAERVEAAWGSPGHPPLMFRARPGMDPGGPRNYRSSSPTRCG